MVPVVAGIDASGLRAERGGLEARAVRACARARSGGRAARRRRRSSCPAASRCSASTPTTPAAAACCARPSRGSASWPARGATGASRVVNARHRATRPSCALDPDLRARARALEQLPGHGGAARRPELPRRRRSARTSRSPATCRRRPGCPVRARSWWRSSWRWRRSTSWTGRRPTAPPSARPTDLAGYLGTVENGRTFGPLAGDTGVGTFGGSEDHTAILCCRRVDAEPVPLRAGPVRAGRGDARPATCSPWRSAACWPRRPAPALATYNRASRCGRRVLQIWRDASGRRCAPWKRR